MPTRHTELNSSLCILKGPREPDSSAKSVIYSPWGPLLGPEFSFVRVAGGLIVRFRCSQFWWSGIPLFSTPSCFSNIHHKLPGSWLLKTKKIIKWYLEITLGIKSDWKGSRKSHRTDSLEHLLIWWPLLLSWPKFQWWRRQWGKEAWEVSEDPGWWAAAAVGLHKCCLSQRKTLPSQLSPGHSRAPLEHCG